ncbi:putative ferric reductase transmembrane component [Papiliotrema laurentii]|uniref:ferric-chelate reductase (NADPH) n=1 Tax=Papiliotrema laurentii TaxID=5418 RepID=A0AAD9FP35_PAPLA|nr:putative ferric reductase transmembrane component [Papiliotrema laurentii]
MSSTIQNRLVGRYIPVIPDQFKIYDSYTEDPKWQIKFTIIWTSVLAFTTLCSIPYTYRLLRHGRYYTELWIQESPAPPDPSLRSDAPPSKNLGRDRESFVRRTGRRAYAVWQSLALWTIPLPTLAFWKSQVGDCCRKAYFSLGVGQMVLVAGYLAASIACFVVGAELVQNSNRPGFIAVAQLPLIVLLSLKSPLPLPIFLPTLSYEHYNFLHRWAGRTLFLLVTVHGAMWLHQFISTDQWDQVWADKTKRGMIAYGLMCGIVLTSLKPVRRVCYQLFWAAHLVLFVGFFAAICYHTPYAQPWVYPCVAIYGYDFVVRMVRYRVKEAILIPVDSTMTMIHIPDCGHGWRPTQHVMLRVLKGAGVFESHPFTITNAPSSTLTAKGITLYAKVSGDWTRRLHAMASDVEGIEVGEDVEERESFLEKTKRGEEVDVADHPGKKVLVTLDGPYGGLKMDLGDHGRVMVVAGGSGVTFALGAVEEAICRKRQGRGQGPDQVLVVWVVRDMSTVEALSPTLEYLYRKAKTNHIDLAYRLYLSQPPSPLPCLPPSLAPFSTLSPFRPEVSQLVQELLPSDHHGPEAAGENAHSPGMAVIACGPEGIVMEARNAVARLGVEERVRAGGVEFHGECYAL